MSIREEDYDEQFGSDSDASPERGRSPPASSVFGDVAATLKRPASASARPRSSGGDRDRHRSRSRSRSPPQRDEYKQRSAAAPRRSQPPPATSTLRDDRHFYDAADRDDADLDGSLAAASRANSDLRTAADTLAVNPNVKKLRPADVAQLKGLSGDAWNKKLEQLVSTVKGDKYSRAPSTHTTLLIDSNGTGGSASQLGARSTHHGGVDHRDPSSAGTGGSHFSANPPMSKARAHKDHMDNMSASAQLFQIAKIVDGAVYGSKAYAGSHDDAVDRPKPRTKDGSKVLDKFALDAEDMLHASSSLRKQVAVLKSDLVTLNRERQLLDAHIVAQNQQLDAQALKKGFLRVSGGVALPNKDEEGGFHSASPFTAEKPRFEKLARTAGGHSSTGGGASKQQSLEDALLTLQIQSRTLRASKSSLLKQLAEAQDHHGAVPSHAADDARAAEEHKRLLLSELHQLQAQLIREKREYQSATDAQESQIGELRHQAGMVQAQLETQRAALTNATLHLQQQNDRKTSMQAKINALRKRLTKYQQ